MFIKQNFKIVFLIFLFISNIHAQDFYLDGSTDSKSIYKIIDPKWLSISQSEANSFLINSGFKNISVQKNEEYTFYTGSFNDSKKYTFYRTLMFKNFQCAAYTDEVVMIRECAECMTSKILANNSYNIQMKRSASSFDKEQKQLFINEIKKSFKKDGINDFNEIFNYQDNFSITKNINKNSYRIVRHASLEKILNSNAYKMTVTKSVISNVTGVIVGERSLDKINTFDLPEMVRLFLEDCKDHGIEVKQSNIVAEFKELEENILGLSYGRNDDKLIKVYVDPVKWSNASKPKKWYLIYHELGHDVLNLSHGNGGKMMFNFIDRSYSWEEFNNDKEIMFKFYNKYYK